MSNSKGESKMSVPLYESVRRKFRRNRSEAEIVLSTVHIFSKLSRSEIRQVENVMHVRHYTMNETIVKQGAPGSGMYIIVSGNVGIYILNHEHEEQLVTELEKGDFFGEIAVLNDAPRTATARALENCTILGFYRPDLLGLLETKPQIGIKILLALSEVLATRLSMTNEELSRAQRQLQKLENEHNDAGE
ncbi:MAG: cyclic nucleotide-binding domain-containing protein [Lentisphaeria bacterium]|nr:cyclic nucleotide-binding domain-containing protein [Candidatus Neomarinimicrobiota bacterium]MCF7843152.1 cyclic nucleotide-binding domain-containing protein [Lentisphaeria bacterium]